MNQADFEAIAERGRTDPAWWISTVLGFDLWPTQVAIAESVRDNRVTSVRSCHGIGKSFVAACIVLWFLLNHPGAIVITTAPGARQVKKILWREIARLHRDAAWPLGGKRIGTELRLRDDWYAWGFTAPEWDPTKFQGFHADHVLVVVDEAAGVAPTVFEGIDSALASGDTRMLMIGNPTDKGGTFGESFDLPHVAPFAVSAFSTPNFTTFGITIDDIRSGKFEDKVNGADLPFPSLINPTWVREKWLSWCKGKKERENDPRWEARVLARFPSSDDIAVCPASWIEDAMARHPGPKFLWLDRYVDLGVDVARFGDDTSEIARRVMGLGVVSINSLPKMDTMGTAAAIMADVNELRSKDANVGGAHIDADGLGAGVFDRVNEEMSDVANGIQNGSSASDPTRFLNKRAELYWRLREAIDPNGEECMCLPDDKELLRQLSTIRWKLTRNGKIQIESKDEIKERLGRSPDKADAVAYSMAGSVNEHPTVSAAPSVARARGTNEFGGV